MANVLQILTPEPASRNRLQGVDELRFVAALAVVLQHTHPFDGAYNAMIRGETQDYIAGILEITIKQGVRFAVPFFFTISGYFLCTRVMNGRPPVASFLRYSKRILTVWFSWSVIYFFIPHQAGLLKQGYFNFVSSKAHHFGTHLVDMLKTGGVGHFYFFPNLLVGISMTTLLYLLRARYLIVLVPALWYCLYLVSLIKTPVSEGFYNDITHNYAFQMFSEGILFVALGWWLRSTHNRFRARSAILIAIAGFMFMLLFEVLGKPAIARIGVIPYTVGLVMLSISLSSGGQDNSLARFGRYTLGIYTSHMLFVFLMVNFGYVLRLYYTIGYYGYTIAYSAVVFSLSLVLSILLAKHKWSRPLVV